MLYNYTLFNTEFGWIAVVGSEAGLRRLTLPQSNSQEAMALIGDFIPQSVANASFFDDLVSQLRHYFQGERVDFPVDLDLQDATSFQRDVWELTRSIPYGEMRTYGWIAQALGRPGGGRAVGQALAQNPLPIVIPCHRVVSGGEKLGGFGGGLEMKKHLLALEASANQEHAI